MSEHRDFDAAIAEIDKTEASTFTLAAETFTVHVPIPVGPILRWVDTGRFGLTTGYARACIALLEACVDRSADDLARQRQVGIEQRKVEGLRAEGADEETIAAADQALALAQVTATITSIANAVSASRITSDVLDELCGYVVRGGTALPLDASALSDGPPSTNGDGSNGDANNEVSDSSTSEPDAQ
jgi:hypothetical protein